MNTKYDITKSKAYLTYKKIMKVETTNPQDVLIYLSDLDKEELKQVILLFFKYTLDMDRKLEILCNIIDNLPKEWFEIKEENNECD